jgi:hypothetical protein
LVGKGDKSDVRGGGGARGYNSEDNVEKNKRRNFQRIAVVIIKFMIYINLLFPVYKYRLFYVQ